MESVIQTRRAQRDARRIRLMPGILAADNTVAHTMDLFTPVRLGDLELANRVVMAPLTRLRSGRPGIPGDLVVEHYAQRAGVGLIITEGTYPNRESQAFAGQPGIVTEEQAAGWRRVADAVHDRGGLAGVAGHCRGPGPPPPLTPTHA